LKVETRRYNIGLFASGSGSNFINIYKHICNGNIWAEISLLISNNSNCKAINFAKNNNINYKIVNNSRFSGNQIDDIMLEILKDYKIDLIVLAGYMKKIPEKVIEYYHNRILNIHPALLPKFGGKGFYGMKVHEAVISSKEKTTGVTIHLVDNNYDTGEIIYQEKIKVMENDTPNSIAGRVLELEHKAYPEVIKKFCENNIN